MDPDHVRGLGKTLSVLGGLLLFALFAFVAFAIFIAMEDRGRDREAAWVIGAFSCGCSIPTLVLTIVGGYLASRK